ncbi:MAG: ATP-binding protein [Candidatus Latescibacterota bacterium]|nr:MAG: ATP-binding protein [Candidatus Latescibacterota bacterium]
MNEIVIMSGKGGTGKTSIAAALGVLAGTGAVVADCDVDAANLHLLYEPENREANEFWSGKTAVIDHESCVECGICEEKCRFDAIHEQDGHLVVNGVDCEGCSVCHHLCPEKAIVMIDNRAGHWYVSKSRFGSWFVHAKLGIGQENSGKLVSKVKQEAKQLAEKEGVPYVIIDGPPGIGCPAIASLSGASHVLIVTEATRSGLHDVERLVSLLEFFKVNASCIVNKFDIDPGVGGEIVRFCQKRQIEVVSQIPYDRVFYEALRAEKTLVETNDAEIKTKVEEVWNHLQKIGGAA